MNNEIGFEVKLNTSYEAAVDNVVAALKTEGFGVLTRIDVKATLKEKLGAEFRHYAILGACNPPLAHRALSQEPAVGLMLPCNVTVEEISAETSLVRIANPEMMMTVGEFQHDPVLTAIASEARSRLERVSQLLGSQ